jgi:flagellar hook-associated protein FlgK
MKLPNDPQKRNDERALWAQIALAAFVAETSTDENTALVEFLAGVMHWCDRTGESFEAHLERARSLYREETSQHEARLAENVG